MLPGLVSTLVDCSTLASGTTINPTTEIAFVSGTLAIATITPLMNRNHLLMLISTGSWTTVTTGNVSLAVTSTNGKATVFMYMTSTGKYYPVTTS